MVNGEEIKGFFRLLNSKNIKYLLIKNDGNLIPNAVADGKGVDILVHPKHYDYFFLYRFECRF